MPSLKHAVAASGGAILKNRQQLDSPEGFSGNIKSIMQRRRSLPKTETEAEKRKLVLIQKQQAKKQMLLKQRPKFIVFA